MNNHYEVQGDIPHPIPQICDFKKPIPQKHLYFKTVQEPLTQDLCTVGSFYSTVLMIKNQLLCGWGCVVLSNKICIAARA